MEYIFLVIFVVCLVLCLSLFSPDVFRFSSIYVSLISFMGPIGDLENLFGSCVLSVFFPALAASYSYSRQNRPVLTFSLSKWWEQWWEHSLEFLVIFCMSKFFPVLPFTLNPCLLSSLTLTHFTHIMKMCSFFALELCDVHSAAENYIKWMICITCFGLLLSLPDVVDGGKSPGCYG